MATLHDAVKSLFATATSAILPGGTFDANNTNDYDWGGTDWAKEQGLINTGIMMAHGKLRWQDSTPHQSDYPVLGAERESVEFYIHDQLGYATIDQAINAIVKPYDEIDSPNSLHNRLIENLDDRQIAWMVNTFISGEMMAEEYSNRPMKFVRFSITHRR